MRNEVMLTVVTLSAVRLIFAADWIAGAYQLPDENDFNAFFDDAPILAKP